MQPITTTQQLADASARLSRHPFVTVDTEFLRESTYYPQLCVAQMASTEEALVVDALAAGIDQLAGNAQHAGFVHSYLGVLEWKRGKLSSAVAHIQALLQTSVCFTHLAWGEPELRFAQQMHELEYGLRASLVALYRGLALRGRVTGETDSGSGGDDGSRAPGAQP
jgi:hypothetical protein